MPQWNLRERFAPALFLCKWLLVAAPLGVVIGSLVAFFLWALDEATQLQFQHSWLLYLLPVAGVASGLMYHFVGKNSDAGVNLVLEDIHDSAERVPTRIVPLVLIGSLLTHLFGGSAGREGVAVQIGGGVASTFGRWAPLSAEDRRILLLCGVASGFGAIFGTPITGAIFALEFVVIGRLHLRAFLPCLAASVIGDQVVAAWGVGHTHYDITGGDPAALVGAAPLNFLLLAKVALAAAAFGLASRLFVELSHALKWACSKAIPIPWLRPAAGGVIVIALVWLIGERDYLGLGVATNPADPTAVTLQTCFHPGGAAPLSWWWKLLFTAVTVSSGFKGGEVTPLFFIGAALGNILAQFLDAPVGLMAGLGFVAVFAGASKTPLACTIMAFELFAPGQESLLGQGFLIYAAVACFLSNLCSGRGSIYSAQRRDTETEAANS